MFVSGRPAGERGWSPGGGPWPLSSYTPTPGGRNFKPKRRCDQEPVLWAGAPDSPALVRNSPVSSKESRCGHGVWEAGPQGQTLRGTALGGGRVRSGGCETSQHQASPASTLLRCLPLGPRGQEKGCSWTSRCGAARGLEPHLLCVRNKRVVSEQFYSDN